MNRYLSARIGQVLQAKMVLLTGPRSTDLHYIRTKDGAEVDFALSEGDSLTHLGECKLSDAKPERALARFAEQWPQTQAVQLVRECKVEADSGRLHIRDAALWMAALEV